MKKFALLFSILFLTGNLCFGRSDSDRHEFGYQLDKLDYGDSGDKRTAADRLGYDIKDDRAIPSAIAVLKAAEAGGDIGVAEKIEPFAYIHNETLLDTGIGFLSSPAWQVRLAAIKSLNELRNVSAESALLEGLSSEGYEELRFNILDALKNMGSMKAKGVALSWLGDSEQSAEVRNYAADYLTEFKDTAAVPLFIKGLQDPSWRVRDFSMNDLATFEHPEVYVTGAVEKKCPSMPTTMYISTGANPSLVFVNVNTDRALVKPYLERLEKESYPLTRVGVAERLSLMKSNQTVEPILKASKKDNSLYVRRKLIWGLGELKDTRAVERLIEALKDEDLEIRKNAVDALGKIKDVRAVSPLLAMTKEPWGALRNSVVDTLGAYGDERAKETMLPLLNDPKSAVRNDVLEQFDNNLKDPVALPGIAKCTTDDVSYVRNSAVQTLGHYQDKKQALPILLKALKDENIDVRVSAINALAEIRAREAEDALIGCLQDNNIAVVLAAISALGDLESDKAVPALMKLVSGTNQQIKQRAIVVLGRIGNPTAAPVLIGVLKDKKNCNDLRGSAAQALGKMRSGTKEMLTALPKEDYWMRGQLVLALGMSGDKRGVPALITSLGKDVWDIRKDAAEALGRIGDKRAIPSLEKACSDRCWEVRYAAREALAWIK